MAGGDASWETAAAGAGQRCGAVGEGEGVGESQGGTSLPRLKRLFGYGKVRYRGLAKNTERLARLFGLGNLLAAEGQLRGSGPGAYPERPSGQRTVQRGQSRVGNGETLDNPRSPEPEILSHYRPLRRNSGYRGPCSEHP